MKPRVVFLGILALALWSCTSADRPEGFGPATVDRERAPGDWIVVRFGAEADSLNPITSTNAYAQYIMTGANGSLLFEQLIRYNPETWRVEAPLLASYPEISDDHLVYTFTLRDGVEWHDGEPFTAEDVLFSIKALKVPFVDDAHVRGYYADLTEVQAEGQTVRFTMSQPYWMNDSVLGEMPLVPKHVYDPEGVLDRYELRDIIAPEAMDDETLKTFGDKFNTHPANRAPIGTGPYKFETWETGTEIILARNDEYWGEKAYLEKLRFRLISDPTAALTALKSGDVDFNPRLSPIQYSQQTSAPSFERQFVKATYTIPSYNYIGWNAERPFFRDKRVRQAMTMLVDREQILETILFGLGTVAASSFNPSSPDFNSSIKAWPYDRKRAAELLDQAGWVDTDGDGIRDKAGVPFRFTLAGSTGSDFVDLLLPVLKEEFKRVGIDMIERKLEFTVLVESLRDQRFDAATLAWVSGLLSDPHQLFHSSSSENRGSNFVNFRNAEADQVIEQARLEFDPEKRKQLYWRFQEILHQEQPYTLLFYPEEAAAYQRRFEDVEWLPVRPGYDLTQWFVPRLSQRHTAVGTR